MKALVVSGTLGVGKTYTAAAIRDALLARGQRVAVIDLDWLCQADPAPANDPYNYGLGFRNLAAVFPNYVAAGADYLILARVVADERDRARYEGALPGAALKIVLLHASAATRRDRLVGREPAGLWRESHVNRTDQLGRELAALGTEDLAVNTDHRTGPEIAAEILEYLGW
ncbi:MAG: hypothetical protein JWN96_3668 [Mycobacterium sp.]|nr:hypothetical protein [Mycobacterium sp.]